jgi:hypothetical protein
MGCDAVRDYFITSKTVQSRTTFYLDMCRFLGSPPRYNFVTIMIFSTGTQFHQAPQANE